MALVRPKNYPIRKITDDTQQLGMIHNPPRKLRGWGNMEMSKDSTFNVEPPVKGSRTAEKGDKAPY